MKIKLKGNKGASNAIVIILLIVIFVIAGFALYLIKNPIVKIVEKETAITPPLANTQAIETPKTYTYKEIKGIYKYSEKLKLDEDFEPDFCYNLYLSDDGTFCYDTYADTMEGNCGNYIINGSEIILNKLYTYGSDTAITVTKGTVLLKINEDGTITDINKYHNLLKNNAILKKENGEIEEFNTLRRRIEIYEKEINNALGY